MSIIVVSDLHLGDRGPRDNFAHPDKMPDFNNFLDYVSLDKLVVAGDLFDFWQVNLSKAIIMYRRLLDRLARMNASYIVGNHDADLKYFVGMDFLGHPFFKRMCTSMDGEIGGKKFLVRHGHEADPYCKSDTPDFGRITAIASGLLEDKQGPLDGEVCVEDRFIGRLEWFSNLYKRFKGTGDRTVELHANMKTLKGDADVLITGHTHMPGRIEGWYFNSGSWARTVNSFVRIEDDGSVGVWDWQRGPVMNTAELQHD
jgi:UDP-2,3-diacylglucosamine pyrophosphatase LpxH